MMMGAPMGGYGMPPPGFAPPGYGMPPQAYGMPPAPSGIGNKPQGGAPPVQPVPQQVSMDTGPTRSLAKATACRGSECAKVGKVMIEAGSTDVVKCGHHDGGVSVTTSECCGLSSSTEGPYCCLCYVKECGGQTSMCIGCNARLKELDDQKARAAEEAERRREARAAEHAENMKAQKERDRIRFEAAEKARQEERIRQQELSLPITSWLMSIGVGEISARNIMKHLQQPGIEITQLYQLDAIPPKDLDKLLEKFSMADRNVIKSRLASGHARGGGSGGGVHFHGDING